MPSTSVQIIKLNVDVQDVVKATVKIVDETNNKQRHFVVLMFFNAMSSSAHKSRMQ